MDIQTVMQVLGQKTGMDYQQALADGYSPQEVLKELIRRYTSGNDGTLNELNVKPSPSEKEPFPKDTTPVDKGSDASIKQTNKTMTVIIDGKKMTISQENGEFVLKLAEDKPQPVKEPSTKPTYKKGETIRVFANDRFNN
jgi:hypothetical protein